MVTEYGINLRDLFSFMLSALQRVRYLWGVAEQIVPLFLRWDAGRAATNSAGTRGCWDQKEKDTASHLADSTNPLPKAETPSCHWVQSTMTARIQDPEPFTDASLDNPWHSAPCQLCLPFQPCRQCLCAPVAVTCCHLPQSLPPASSWSGYTWLKSLSCY